MDGKTKLLNRKEKNASYGEIKLANNDPQRSTNDDETKIVYTVRRKLSQLFVMNNHQSYLGTSQRSPAVLALFCFLVLFSFVLCYGY